MHRRHFIKSIAALSSASALSNAFAEANSPSGIRHNKKLLVISNSLGYNPPTFWPTEQDTLSFDSRLLAPLKGLENKATLIRGLDHHSGRRGHEATNAFLTGYSRMPKDRIYRQASLDQIVAKNLKTNRAVESLIMMTSKTGYRGDHSFDDMVSWNTDGEMVFQDYNPLRVYDKLIGSEAYREAISLQKTIVDRNAETIQGLIKKAPKKSKEYLETYVDSIHRLTQSINKSLDRNYFSEDQSPIDIELSNDCLFASSMLNNYHVEVDLALFALESDLTDVALITSPSKFVNVTLPQSGEMSKNTYHGSTHGSDPGNKEVLYQIESNFFAGLKKIVTRLDSIKRPSGMTLLDETVVLFGGGMGDASKHTVDNMPFLVFGGNFKHGSYVSAPADLPASSFLDYLASSFGIADGQFTRAKSVDHDWSNYL